jgi:hypothetical protein
MKLQRYPDGGNEWTLFIWGRHPKWSHTWTHSLTLTKQRRETGKKRWSFYRIPGAQSRYGVTVAGHSLQLMTQKATPRRDKP